jgi:replicative DNA helicase
MATTSPNGRATAEGRVPPHDQEAEAGVLGALLLDQAAIARTIDLITADDFYRANNGAVYRAALALFREGAPIDNVTLAAALQKAGLLERVGGRAHLAMLQESVPTAANVEHYARLVRDKATKRRLISAGGAVAALGYDDALEADEATDRAGREVLAIGQDQARGASSAGEAATEMLEWLERIEASGKGLPGLPSGLHDLDALTGGWKDGELVVIGARPSTGKTSLGLQCAIEAAEAGRSVAFFSLETSRLRLMVRAACSVARVDSRRVERGMLNEHEHDRLHKAIDRLSRLPIQIDDRPGLEELALVAQARRLKVQEGTGLIVVDYLQLVGGRRPDDRVQEVAAVTRTLKRLAGDLQVPVIALAQLNRGVEQRGDKRPVMSDLKESGEIEQTADVVVLIHPNEEDPAACDLIVAKHRNGPTGTARVGFRREFTRFESVERRERVA